MKIPFKVLLGLSALLLAETAIAQSNYWDPRPVPEEKQEQATATKAARIIVAAPIMPRSATTSGFCCVTYDVNEKGIPVNIDTPFCSEKKFRRPTVRALRKWRFNPAIRDGETLRTNHYSTITTYRLNGQGGSLIPDKAGLILRDGEIDFSKEYLCPLLGSS